METEAAASQVERYEAKCVMVSETRRLMTGMSKTVARLEEFKAFMPESILQNETANEAETIWSSATPTSRSTFSSAGGSNTGKYIEANYASKPGLGLHLITKPVGLLFVNVVGWRAVCSGSADGATVLINHTDLVTCVLDVVVMNDGVLDSFSGDHFLVGWNTAKPKTDCTQHAVLAAFALQSGSSHRFSCAVTSGRARVGTTGTKAVRRLSLISPLVPWVKELEAFAKTHGYSCVSDERSASRFENIVRYRVVDAMYSSKRQIVSPILHLTELLRLDAAEWMYELQQAQDGNTDGEMINKLAYCMIDGDWKRFERLLPSEEFVTHLSETLQAYVPEKSFKPLQRGFERCPETCGALVKATGKARQSLP
eukprot:TRINITY_DN4226_c0_g2_i1.p1 TRINITY_DN4226_c0_g2~~TRINITY_DN4226_c0_g2_i1.p1  ORF type:complete len:431 (+),score=92.34 TRINITY_DN4226_c0_g2_i1:188-1294(+)